MNLKSKKVLLLHIPHESTETDIISSCTRFGSVRDVKIFYAGTWSMYEFVSAKVTFMTTSGASNALEAGGTRIHPETSRIVSIKLYKSTKFDYQTLKNWSGASQSEENKQTKLESEDGEEDAEESVVEVPSILDSKKCAWGSFCEFSTKSSLTKRRFLTRHNNFSKMVRELFKTVDENHPEENLSNKTVVKSLVQKNKSCFLLINN